MTRARLASWILGVAILLLLVAKSVTAIGPGAILLHGGELQAPIVVRPQIGSFIFMWAVAPGTTTRAEPPFRRALMAAVISSTTSSGVGSSPKN